MIPTFRIAMVSLLAIMANAAAIADDRASQLGKLMQGFVQKQDFMGSVLVTENGKEIFKSGYGMADAELSVPNTPKTKFRVGSVTKQFTAMAIMILAERGKLKLDDRLVDVVPGLPTAWSGIKLTHLLNHTSGITHSWEIPGFSDKIQVSYPLDKMIEDAKNVPLLFEPGADFHYSGLGYFLLARVIEKASGVSYDAFLKAEIFDPLGMKDTGADNYVPILPGRALGYSRANGILQNAKIIYLPNLTGGGNLYSTVEDLARWDQALTAGKLVSAASYKAIYTPVKKAYGYGWRIDEIEGHKLYDHGGSVNGFRAYIGRIPDRKIGIFILSNDEHSAEFLKDMEAQIEKIALKK